MMGDPVSGHFTFYQTKLFPLPTYCSQSRRCCPDSRSPRHTGRSAVCTGPGRRTATRSTCTETREGSGRSRSRRIRPRSHRLRHSARSLEHISCWHTETRSVHTNCCRLALQKKSTSCSAQHCSTYGRRIHRSHRSSQCLRRKWRPCRYTLRWHRWLGRRDRLREGGWSEYFLQISSVERGKLWKVLVTSLPGLR